MVQLPESRHSFHYPRIDNSGLKFQSEEAKELANRIGNLPAQAHLARKILSQNQNGR